MTREDFILRTCISMSSNKLFTSDGRYDNIRIDTSAIVDCATLLADNLEHDFGPDIFDDEAIPTLEISLCDIANDIADIKKSLIVLANK